MGDMPEPKYHSPERANTSVMTIVSATLGRNFIRTKDFQDAQIMSAESVTGRCSLRIDVLTFFDVHLVEIIGSISERDVQTTLVPQEDHLFDFET